MITPGHHASLRVQAIGKRDFSSFAALSMRDSNQLHAVCLDTTPPCVYMNDVSHAVQELVHRINEVARKNIVSPPRRKKREGGGLSCMPNQYR